MTTLSEKTTAELKGMIERCDALIRKAERLGNLGDVRELINFRNDVDSELDRRGA